MESPSKASARLPCWKKKEPDVGFLANVKDHLDQFVSASMDQHKICLKKTMRGLEDIVRLKKQGKPSSSSSLSPAPAPAMPSSNVGSGAKESPGEDQ